MSVRCIFPGSFDPVTSGHMDIIARLCALFEEVVVLVSLNGAKRNCFSREDRVGFLRDALAAEGLKNARVESAQGLLADYARSQGIYVLAKGVRTAADFEYEAQMAALNRKLDARLETLLMMADGKFAHISSSAVREFLRLGADIEGLVPDSIRRRIVEGYQSELQPQEGMNR